MKNQRFINKLRGHLLSEVSFFVIFFYFSSTGKTASSAISSNNTIFLLINNLLQFSSLIGSNHLSTLASLITAGKKAGIEDPVWPHKLRHTFATSLLRRGGNIYYIKELLGHQHITTTQTYLSATNQDLKKTQNLLQTSRAEQYIEEEQLDPMPENIIIKD